MMKTSTFYLVLIITLMGLPVIKSDPFWITYYREEIHADCYLIDFHYFCHQTEESSTITSCKNGKLWTLEILKELNVTTDHLIDWLIPLDLIEQYATYLNNNDSTLLAELTVCNCTQNWVGRECDYPTDYKSRDPGRLLTLQAMGKDADINGLLIRFIDGIVCTGADLFLEWRHICDGITQCQNGVDELHCDLLEFHRCEEDEFQCRNGMCIPIEFAFDAMPDCMDSSDEQQTETMNKVYYNCIGKTSVNCDSRQCRKDQFSCGNGERIHWSSVFQNSKGCSNHRQAAYICETMEYLKIMPDELYGICNETIVDLPSLTNTSDCLESFGHLLRSRHNTKLRLMAFDNVMERCEQLIVYSAKKCISSRPTYCL